MGWTSERKYGSDVPDDVVEQVRAICFTLPETSETQAWAGTRWLIRKKSFAHVLRIYDGGSEGRVALVFRAEGDDLDALRRVGPPFAPINWGRNALTVTLDEHSDWDEVHELITDSYCTQAPKKLAALVNRPSPC